MFKTSLQIKVQDRFYKQYDQRNDTVTNLLLIINHHVR